jgi:hypothetical protein
MSPWFALDTTTREANQHTEVDAHRDQRTEINDEVDAHRDQRMCMHAMVVWLLRTAGCGDLFKGVEGRYGSVCATVR